MYIIIFILILCIIIFYLINYYLKYIDNFNNNIYIIAIPGNQFGNMIRHISTLWIYSQIKNYNFKIDLKNNNNNDILILKECIDNNYFNDIPIYKEIHESDIYLNIKGTNHSLINEISFKNDYIINSNIGIASIYSGYDESISENDFIKYKIYFYKNIFKIPDIINKKINNNIYKYNNIEYCCHIRYTDNLMDNLKQSLQLNTDINIFIDKIKLINQKILIFTDNKVIITKYLDDNNIDYIFPDILFDNNKFQALYEMVLMGKIKNLIGSCSSSFSYEAFFINSNITGKTFIEYNSKENKWNNYTF